MPDRFGVVGGATGLRAEIQAFWDEAACGEVYARGSSPAARFAEQSRTRYALEPYIEDFARFPEGAGLDVLEVGVGMGADHLRWAEQGPRRLVGIDFTGRAVDFTKQRLSSAGYPSPVLVADGEELPFADESFDIVWSWGVLHHSPDTARAFREVHRVLRVGGTGRLMIYHRRSIVGYLLWARYGLLAGRPGRSLDDVYAHHLESPGTKAFSIEDARALAAPFSEVSARSQISFGDLLEGEVGQRHRGRLLSMAKRLWPRSAIRRFLPGHGLMLLIEAVK